MWVDRLTYDLVWRLNGDFKRDVQNSLPRTYRAPSFSWASTEGCVTNFASPRNSWRADVEVVDWSTKVKGKSPFRQVEYGQLTLNGSLVSATIHRVQLSKSSRHSKPKYRVEVSTWRTTMIKDVPLGRHQINQNADEEWYACREHGEGTKYDHTSLKDKAFLLYVGTTGSHQLFLVLGRSPDSPEMYERLGLVRTYVADDSPKSFGDLK